MLSPTINIKPKSNKDSSQGGRKPRRLKYSCKVFYLAMRSNIECGWRKHGNKSYAFISDVLPNIQIYSNREKVIEKQNE